MKFKLENPQHQITAIRSVVEVFRGMEKNTYDNAHHEDIHSNVCSLSPQELADNMQRVVEENGVPSEQSCLMPGNDACIEMETGTGKTLTYICVDNKLEDATVDYFMEHTDTKFICIERALDSTKKFNLKKKMGDKFYAF